jgi:hypothetical protein
MMDNGFCFMVSLKNLISFVHVYNFDIDGLVMLFRLEENKKLVLTPFEKNLDIWRQLWRVVERSDLVSWRALQSFT